MIIITVVALSSSLFAYHEFSRDNFTTLTLSHTHTFIYSLHTVRSPTQWSRARTHIYPKSVHFYWIYVVWIIEIYVRLRENSLRVKHFCFHSTKCYSCEHNIRSNMKRFGMHIYVLVSVFVRFEIQLCKT